MYPQLTALDIFLPGRVYHFCCRMLPGEVLGCVSHRCFLTSPNFPDMQWTAQKQQFGVPHSLFSILQLNYLVEERSLLNASPVPFLAECFL
jgi:hypothetical protein